MSVKRMYYDAAVIYYGDNSSKVNLREIGQISLNTAVIGQKKSPNVTQCLIDEKTVVFDSHWLTNQPLFVFVGRGKLIVSHELNVILSLAGTELVASKAAFRNFLKRGTMQINYCPFENVKTVMPGDCTTIARQNPNIEVYRQTRPPGVALDPNEIEPVLYRHISKLTEGRNVALALSGGIDTTLIASLYAKMSPGKKITGFTAHTRRGRDLEYARKVAKKLEIELVEVTLPDDAEALNLHRAMTASSLSPMPFSGVTIGYSAVCRKARTMGFDAILDGSGSDTFFGGNYGIHGKYWALDKRQIGNSERVQKYLDWVGENELVNAEIIKTIKDGELTYDFVEKMYEETTRTLAFSWIYRYCAIAKAQGIDILMPYFHERIANFILNDLDQFFIDGISKVPLRRLLNKSVGHEIAYRRDVQGLRFPVRDLLKAHRPEINRTSRNFTYGLSFLWPFELTLIINGVFGKGRYTRLYALAVLADAIEKSLKKQRESEPVSTSWTTG